MAGRAPSRRQAPSWGVTMDFWAAPLRYASRGEPPLLLRFRCSDVRQITTGWSPLSVVL